MARIRTCPGVGFFTGKSVCEIDYDKIKALVLTKHGVKLDYETMDALRTACHADVPNRAYGFPTIINWEPNGGEAQTSQVGYGPNAYNGMSARTDALTLDRYRHYLRAQILKNVEEEFDMYLIDIKNNLYGLNDGTEVIVKPRGSSGTADPLDQRSSVGWKGVHAAAILYDEYIVRVECGSSYSGQDKAN